MFFDYMVNYGKEKTRAFSIHTQRQLRTGMISLISRGSRSFVGEGNIKTC
jgi:hypothetical protein